MALVWIPPLLRDLTGGCESVSASGASIAQVIADLERQYPGIRDRLCRGDELRPGLAVVVDSRASNLGLLEVVKPDSEVHFLPAISGGCEVRYDESAVQLLIHELDDGAADLASVKAAEVMIRFQATLLSS
jgi:molybdopterin synthase sulfur carrier subunit